MGPLGARVHKHGVRTTGWRAGALGRFLERRRWPLVLSVCIVVSGMAYSIWWGSLVDHVSYWVVPGDIWSTMRVAHLIGWGGGSLIYSGGFIMNAFPGIAFVLTPVALVASALHLSESFPFPLAHPSAWPLVGPVEMALGTVGLFALDDLARRLAVPARCRRALLVAEAALVWPVVAMWGHPEDLVALAFATWGLMAAFDGRDVRCALFFAAAVAMQPLALLAVPLAAAYVPWRRWAKGAVIVVTPSLALLAIPLATAWHATIRAIVTQPTFPSIDHPTPWVALAPLIERYREPTKDLGIGVHNGGHGALETVVAAGPERLIAVGVAVALGVWVARRRPPEIAVVWFAGAAFGARCLFDSVLCPYYVAPCLALVLVTAGALGWRRLGAACAAVAACSWSAYRIVGSWDYYVVLGVLLLTALVLACPDGVRSRAVALEAARAPLPISV